MATRAGRIGPSPKSSANGSDCPVVIAGAGARVYYANDAAEAFLAADRGALRVRHGCLRAVRTEDDVKLQQVLRRACANPCGASAALTVRPVAGLPTYSLAIVPLRPHATPTGDEGLLALITLGGGASSRHADVRMLSQLFRLSPAEARVVVRVAAGAPLKTLADELGVSLNTVRSQLQAAFAKTGAHRQAELVQLVGTLPRVGA